MSGGPLSWIEVDFQRQKLEVGEEDAIAEKARIREKGQLTIPARIRREAQLREGSVVELEVVEGGVLLTPQLVVGAGPEVDAAFVRSVIADTEAGYAALRDDPDAWARELEERELLEGSLGDSLD